MSTLGARSALTQRVNGTPADTVAGASRDIPVNELPEGVSGQGGDVGVAGVGEGPGVGVSGRAVGVGEGTGPETQLMARVSATWFATVLPS